eukprot:8263215-Pyramimonas_sp.AAC.1
MHAMHPMLLPTSVTSSSTPTTSLQKSATWVGKNQSREVRWHRARGQAAYTLGGKSLLVAKSHGEGTQLS